MRSLRTLPIRRLYAIVAAVAALAITGGIAQAALSGSGDTPPPKPLDRAIYDAARAPAVDGVTARIRFTNDLIPAGALPNEDASPLAAGAEGRLWLARDGRFRLELQSDAGDAQVTYDGERITVYDPLASTVYRMAWASEPQPAGDEVTLPGIRRALDTLAHGWTISGARPTNTADRPSYTVRLAPRDDGGLLGAAELAWDAANGTPLRAAVYAQGQNEPVLELEATEISFERVPESALTTEPPAGARVVEVDPLLHDAAGAEGTRVRGVKAVQRRLDFPLAAPDELAGLPRRSVQLMRLGDRLGAMVTYGEGLGAIAVFQQKAGEEEGSSTFSQLPQVNIDGATGTELATALGTLVMFERDGVTYTVAGSVPPVAAESAARDLR